MPSAQKDLCPSSGLVLADDGDDGVDGAEVNEVRWWCCVDIPLPCRELKMAEEDAVDDGGEDDDSE